MDPLPHGCSNRPCVNGAAFRPDEPPNVVGEREVFGAKGGRVVDDAEQRFPVCVPRGMILRGDPAEPKTDRGEPGDGLIDGGLRGAGDPPLRAQRTG